MSIPSAAPPVASRFAPLAAGSLIVALAVAYSNTFSVPFLFDDVAAITQNPSIEHFSTALSSPAALSVTGRPLANLSLALNYAISGRAVWSYHALNLALHIACALVLVGLVRRTLGSGCGFQPQNHRLEADATKCAFATAALWALHPLNTSAVTYVMQRTELLVSLCYLLTLYAFARATVCHPLDDKVKHLTRGRKGDCHLMDDKGIPLERTGWLSVSVSSCLLGMGAKEVMVTAPLAVLLFDRTFVAGSFRAALLARPRFYVALASTWLLLACLLLGTDSRGDSAGFAVGMPWTDYARTQLFAIPHYLRLALWPQPLVFDYGNAIVREPMLIATGGIVVVAGLVATVVALVRWPKVGFCGALFFLLLAPSSSVVPIVTQTVAEHRTYLALAAPLALLAVALERRLRRGWLPIGAGLALVLGAATFARNSDYATAVSIWRDTTAKAPDNARAHYNLGVCLLADSASRDPATAASEFIQALRLDPSHPLTSRKLGETLLGLGRAADALPHLETAARQDPLSAATHYALGNALVQLTRTADAAAHYAEAVRLEPTHAVARYNFGNALAQLGRYQEALTQFEEAARLDPKDESARNNAARIREYLKR